MLIILLWYLSPPTHALTGSNAAFSFVTTAVSVMEEDGEMAKICIMLEDLATGVELGCPVTATLNTLNGNDASMFVLDLINGLQFLVHYIIFCHSCSQYSNTASIVITGDSPYDISSVYTYMSHPMWQSVMYICLIIS